MKPSSFCTICTYTCYQELIGLLLSLSLHHTGATIYCMVDTKTKCEIERMTPQPKLNIVWKVSLDKYTGLNRQIMEQRGIIKEFWNNKFLVSYDTLIPRPETELLVEKIFPISNEINKLFVQAAFFLLPQTNGTQPVGPITRNQ